MFRITTDDLGSNTVVHVHGQLGGLGAAELERECAAAAGSLSVDLSNLSTADSEGVSALRALRTQGVHLDNTPGLIELLLAQPEGAEGHNVRSNRRRSRDRSPGRTK